MSLRQSTFLFLSVVVSLLATSFTFAQTDAPPASDVKTEVEVVVPNLTPNLNHDRHLTHHNEKHPTVKPDDRRFFTTRSSQVMLPLPEEEDAFTFAVFGDRTGGPADGVNILADAVRDVNLIEPDLVMTVGDLINGYNRPDAWMVQMKEFKTIMGELRCPWFPVAGNHDVYWRPLGDTTMPLTQHDENYEMHFGPLWYSFQQKNCNFIVLYSDEGNPETGEKTFSKPESQKISDAQFAFLKAALKRGKNNDHQFLFLHHPRWLGGGYGDDWKVKVHPLLKQAGNVTAVFAGHIHYMRYDPLDGIEYVTLATVGGGQSNRIPDAGYLHQYHLVTVRPKQVAMAAFPVGEAMNVREITAELQQQARVLANNLPQFSDSVAVTSEGPETKTIDVTVTNPVDRPIDFTLTPASADSHWVMVPNHAHGRLEPGASETIAFRLEYLGEGIDEAFQGVTFTLSQDYLAKTTRYSIPNTQRPVEFDIQMPEPTGDVANRALLLDGVNDTLGIESAALDLPAGPFTLECWFNAKSYSRRVGLLAKTQSSEYSIFLSNGTPSASLHLDEKYRSVRSDRLLPTDQWTHIAMVYGGDWLALYVNGEELARTEVDPAWKQTRNTLPLFIGADPDGAGSPGSFFHGLIDDVRISRGAIYTENFTPQRRLEVTAETQLLFGFDRSVGPIIFESGPKAIHSQAIGGARLVPVE